MTTPTPEQIEDALRRFDEEADRSLINYDHTTCALLRASVLNIRTAIYSLQAENTSLKAEIVRKDAVLQELSCLGNGGTPGNSIGNLIAQKALAPQQPEGDKL